MLLALDTSDHQASIALVRGDQLVAELTWEVGRKHSQELLDRVNWLCASCGTRAADLTGVAVALGPGSFNGARVAVTTAKSLAFALAIPVYGCSTLDVIAYGHSAAVGTLLAVVEAGRDEVYAGQYASRASDATITLAESQSVSVQLAPGLWRVGEPRVIDPASIARDIAGAFRVCGECSDATRAAIAHAAPGRAHFAPSLGGRRASWLATLAFERIARNAPDHATKLEPLYLRRPAITLPARHAQPDTTPTAADATSATGSKEGTADALRH